jgi:transcription initiation factor TFIIIB Brf1 subunit/transcription initiation factor TFIIB
MIECWYCGGYDIREEEDTGKHYCGECGHYLEDG